MLIYVGIKDGQEEMDDTKPSSSCSSPARNSYEEGYSLDVTDEFSAVDGEVGRRLNQMVPVPVSLHFFLLIPILFNILKNDSIELFVFHVFQLFHLLLMGQDNILN